MNVNSFQNYHSILIYYKIQYLIHYIPSNYLSIYTKLY